MAMDMLVRPIQGSPFCGARTKATGNPCRKPAGWNTSHAGFGRCTLHGGSTPTQESAANLAMARQTAQLFAVPREVHPYVGLMEEYWRTAGMVDSYEAMCAGLLPAEVVWGTQTVEESGAAEGTDGGESMTPPERKTRSGAAINLWVKLFNEERDRFSRLGAEIIKLDLASRQVEYTQSQVSALVSVLLSPELSLSDDQRRAAARLLRGIEARTPATIEGATT